MHDVCMSMNAHESPIRGLASLWVCRRRRGVARVANPVHGECPANAERAKAEDGLEQKTVKQERRAEKWLCAWCCLHPLELAHS